MAFDRIPSGPLELRRWVEMTESQPEEEHGWERLAVVLADNPGRRAWFEELMRELFIERVLGSRGSVAVICNIARRCQLVGLSLFFARYLEEPLDSWSDADVRSLMGALLELSPGHADIERVEHHGERPDVFAVAIHLIATLERERDESGRALAFLRAHLARALEGAKFPERIWDSLAKLYLDQRDLRKAITAALADTVSEEHGKHFLAALGARVARETDARVGPAMDTLHRELERLLTQRRASTSEGEGEGDTEGASEGEGESDTADAEA